MPMFGSISGGKSDVSGTSNYTSKSASKEARSKEDTDQGAMGPDPNTATLHQLRRPIEACQVHRIPENVSPYFFWVQVMPLVSNGTESPVLPPYAWNEQIITDTLSPSIDVI